MKIFVLTDQSKNSHGFAINISKLRLERFKQNPVMLYNHDKLVGKWKDLEIKDGKLVGTPVFMDDEKEEHALKIKNRVEKDFVKSASLGINIIDVQWNEELDYPIVEAEVFECSVVDIPSNANAVTLYNSDGERLEGENLQVQLSALGKPKPAIKSKSNMKLSVKSLTTLGLDNDSSDEAVNSAIQKLQSDYKNAQTKLELLESKEVDSLISTALKEGRITALNKEKFEKLAASDLDLAKEMIEGLPAKKKLSEKTKKEKTKVDLNDRSSWTFEDWRKKDTAGLLAIKRDDPDQYDEIVNL